MSGTRVRKLFVTSDWSDAIDAFGREMAAAGQPETTRYLRLYHLRRLAHDHRDVHPWAMTRTQLVDWMSAHDWMPETRRSWRASLRRFYQWGHAAGHIPVDISYTLPRIAVPRALPRPAPDDAVDHALDTADLRTRLIVAILVFTGMRRGEVARLHTDDLTRDLDGWSLHVVGKGGRERWVPVDDDLSAAIRLMPSGYLFPGRIDGHLSPAHLGRIVSRALPGRWTAHTLRHRFATLAHEVHHDIRAVQELLGHASIASTQRYTFVPRQTMREAATGARRGLVISGAHHSHDAHAGRLDQAARTLLADLAAAARDQAARLYGDDEPRRLECEQRLTAAALDQLIRDGRPPDGVLS